MTEETAFLQAIRADPEDDTPRLVYADWLDDHGRPDRAEFIRLQCRLGRLPRSDRERGALEKRQAQLLEWNRRTWLGTLDEFCMPCSFRRGFPEVIILEHDTLTREFIDRAADLFPLAPLVELELCYGAHPVDPEVFQALAGVHQLCHLRTLRVSYCDHLSESALLALLDSPFWTGLRRLAVRRASLPPSLVLAECLRLRFADRAVLEWD